MQTISAATGDKSEWAYAEYIAVGVMRGRGSRIVLPVLPVLPVRSRRLVWELNETMHAASDAALT